MGLLPVAAGDAVPLPLARAPAAASIAVSSLVLVWGVEAGAVAGEPLPPGGHAASTAQHGLVRGAGM